MIEDILNESENGMSNYHSKPSEMHLVINIKKQLRIKKRL